MIKQTKQQRENTLDALNNMWPSIPPKNVMPELNDWINRRGRKRATCKTIACFGGWCAWWPNFRAQGVEADWNGKPVLTERSINLATHVCLKLFGTPDLFLVRGGHAADGNFEGSDHELVTRRLQWVLENSEVK